MFSKQCPFGKKNIIHLLDFRRVFCFGRKKPKKRRNNTKATFYTSTALGPGNDEVASALGEISHECRRGDDVTCF